MMKLRLSSTISPRLEDERPLPSFGAARFSCGDVVGRACLQLHAGEPLLSLWFLRPRALAVWRVPHLTLLTCAVVGFECSAHPHLADL